jgi:hypothetical protein
MIPIPRPGPRHGDCPNCGYRPGHEPSKPKEPDWWWDLGVRGRRAMLITRMPDAEVLDIDTATMRGAAPLLDVHGVGETTVREIVIKCREAHGYP